MWKTFVLVGGVILSGLWTTVTLVADVYGFKPEMPWQWYALIGFLTFGILVSLIIYTKQRRINQLEEQFEYSLSFDGLDLRPVGEMLEIGLELTNTIEKPIEYIVEKYYLEIDGNRLPDCRYKNRGQVIPSKKPTLFKFPALKMPNNIPCKGLLRYELIYGRPGKLIFRQIREMELTVRSSVRSGKSLVWQFTHQEDSPIKK